MVLTEEKELLRNICTKKRGINLETVEEVILLAVEIAREGREGRKVGTMRDLYPCAAVTRSLSPVKKSEQLTH